MHLSLYDIIKGPILSDKARALNEKLGRLVLEVHRDATKPQIKDAIEKLFDVKVDRVCTLIRKYPPTKGFGVRRKATTTTLKKMKIAYVTMKEGYSLNMFGGHEGSPVMAEESTMSINAAQ